MKCSASLHKLDMIWSDNNTMGGAIAKCKQQHNQPLNFGIQSDNDQSIHKNEATTNHEILGFKKQRPLIVLIN